MPTEAIDAPDGAHLHLLIPAGAGASFAQVRAAVDTAARQGWAAVVIEAGPGGLEAITALAALTATTRDLGLIAEVDPAVMPPYTAARRLASLDHVSGGRAGWRMRASLAPGQRAEYARLLRALWDSWQPDAHRFDRTAGIYVDTDRVKPVAHAGTYYTVAGPLDVPRPPQRHPVLYGHAGDTAAGLRPDLESARAPACQPVDGWHAWDALYPRVPREASDASKLDAPLPPRGANADAPSSHCLLAASGPPAEWPARIAALRVPRAASGTASGSLRQRWALPVALGEEANDAR